MESEKHILSTFDQALSELTGSTEQLLEKASELFKANHRGLFEQRKDLVNEVIAEYDDVERIVEKIEHKAKDFILKFSPFATDLRIVLACMKISLHVENMNTYLYKIAKTIKKAIKEEQNIEHFSKCEQVDNLFNNIQDEVDLLHNQFQQKLAEANKKISVKSLEKVAKSISKVAKESASQIFQEDNSYQEIHFVFIIRYLDNFQTHVQQVAEEINQLLLEH